jgi:hypothetical protein
MKQTIPTGSKFCATCKRWGGSRRPDTFLIYVEVDSNEKGTCYQGGYNQLPMMPMGSCSKWEQQYKK